MLRGILIVLILIAAGSPARSAEEAGTPRETLYNGIRLPYPWPPQHGEFIFDPQIPPYLISQPAIIGIDTGRQLFVDDFLIERSTLRRTFHAAEYHPANPVLRPDKEWEKSGNYPTAMPYVDGVYHDPRDNLFKMWYMAGYRGTTCYATSRDGVHWDKPILDVKPGTNIVLGAHWDFSCAALDLADADPKRRFKLFNLVNGYVFDVYCSADGMHWGDPITRMTPGAHDGNQFFYNPFRKMWLYSLRGNGIHTGRLKYYSEHPDLIAGASWKVEQPVKWIRAADRIERLRTDMLGYKGRPGGFGQSDCPSIYGMGGVAYESVIVGLFSIMRGWTKYSAVHPEHTKACEIELGFTRDGFHWDRPAFKAFMPLSENPQAWNYGKLNDIGGGFLVVGDKLFFYFSGRGVTTGCQTGIAVLRRDGFASMNAGDKAGTLTTRPVMFKGKHLFVNADTREGELRVEVLDKDGKAIPSFTAEDCIAVKTDSTLQAVQWKGGGDLSALAGQAVKFRFHLTKRKLYAFWVSPDKSGASHGYVASGGPGFTGAMDTVGMAALEAAEKLKAGKP